MPSHFARIFDDWCIDYAVMSEAWHAGGDAQRKRGNMQRIGIFFTLRLVTWALESLRIITPAQWHDLRAM